MGEPVFRDDIPSLSMKSSSMRSSDILGSPSSSTPPSSPPVSPRSPRLVVSSTPANKPLPSAHAIHTLPLELLTLIFEIGTQENIEEAPRTRPQEYAPNFEVTVSQVCRYWRETALKASQLWTFISFREVTHMDRARVYIERAKERPLDITVDTVAAKNHVPNMTLFREEFYPVFNIVLPSVSRWRSLVLKVRDYECKTFAKEILSTCGPAPWLERIELYHIEDAVTQQSWFAATLVRAVCIFDANIPNLRKLTLTGVNLPWKQSMPFLRNLEVIQFALHAEDVRPTYSEWSEMLLACPKLRRLQLHYSGPRQGNDWPSPPIPLPALEDLSISNLDSPYLCVLFRHLFMPALWRLHLELPPLDTSNVQNPYDPFITEFSNIASPYFRSLTYLQVTALECSRAAWRNFLKCYPNITTLDLDCGLLDPSFLLELTTLTYPNEGPNTAPEPDTLPTVVLCPNVTTMKVKGLSANFMRDFIVFRNKHGLPIARWLVSESDRAEVEKLGFDVPVEYFRDPNDADDGDNDQWDDEVPEDSAEDSNDDDDDANDNDN